MEKELKEFIERVEIADLLTRYFAAVDDKCLDIRIVESIFAVDAQVIRPDGSGMVGRENILNGHIKSFDRFKATHHVITNSLVDIQEEKATLRSNVIANHMWKDSDEHPQLNNKNFLANGVFSAEAKKVCGQWFITKLKLRVVWRTGDGMKEILDFVRSNE